MFWPIIPVSLKPFQGLVTIFIMHMRNLRNGCYANEIHRLMLSVSALGHHTKPPPLHIWLRSLENCSFARHMSVTVFELNYYKTYVEMWHI